MSTQSLKPCYVVRRSKLHGNGVFATRKILAGTKIFQYNGARISAEEADNRYPVDPENPFHTFYFALTNGKIIDGGTRGNEARWINHSCEPNCEAQESNGGQRVYIMALNDIARGQELYYDYRLCIDARLTKKLKQNYCCLCGTASCRGTMLALPEKKKKNGK